MLHCTPTDVGGSPACDAGVFTVVDVGVGWFIGLLLRLLGIDACFWGPNFVLESLPIAPSRLAALSLVLRQIPGRLCVCTADVTSAPSSSVCFVFFSWLVQTAYLRNSRFSLFPNYFNDNNVQIRPRLLHPWSKYFFFVPICGCGFSCGRP